jgi:hypothetical protein
MELSQEGAGKRDRGTLAPGKGRAIAAAIAVVRLA